MDDLDEFLAEKLGYRQARPEHFKQAPWQVWAKREANFERSKLDAVERIWRGALYRHATRWPTEPVAEMAELFPLPERCPVFGLALDYTDGRASSGISIDRIDNSRGYVPGNVQIISRHANRVKNNGTMAEHLAIAAYMQKHGAGRLSPCST